jgi:hypothetical protein
MPQDDSDQAWLKQASCQQRHCSRSDACQSADGPCGAVECVAHHINNLPPAILHGIFGHLGPRELCAVSAVCSHWRQLNQDKAANGVWKKFYTSRWRVLGSSGEDVCWQTKYGSKMKQVLQHALAQLAPCNGVHGQLQLAGCQVPATIQSGCECISCQAGAIVAAARHLYLCKTSTQPSTAASAINVTAGIAG